jgi:hypothetical protein
MKHTSVMFRIVKILGIGYITLIFFIFAFIFGYSLDRFFVYLYGESYDKKTPVELALEICSHIIVLGILAYLVRVFVKNVPFPLDKMYGYNHRALKETDGGVFYAVLLMFQYHMQDKIIYTSKLILKMLS